MSGFRFIDYRGDRPIIADVPEGEMKKFVTLDCDMSDEEFIKMIDEVNRKGCRLVCKDELMYEEEHINRAVLKYSFAGAWQDFFSILLHNGYEITARADDDEIEITWKDKQESLLDWVMKDANSDRVEEIKREARKIGETL